MANDEIDIKISAQSEALKSGMDQAAQAVAQASERMKQAFASASSNIDSQFKKIGDTINGVNKYMMGFVAVLAGGGALKKFISDANEWNSSAAKMAGQMGISTEKASVLNTALARMGMDADLFLQASTEMTKKTQENAAAFKTLGVDVKDSTGNYRPMLDVMTDVNAKLVSIKNPVEQNIAGMKVYGEGWNEIKGVLKINAQAMKDAEARAKELGLIVGPEGAAMSKQYSAQMKELNLVGKSIEVQFGNAILPVFAKLGSFMAQEGPQAGAVFGTVISGIGFAAASTWLALKDMGDGIGAMFAQVAALLSGDLSNPAPAVAAFRAIGAERDAQAAKNEAAYEKLKTQFFAPTKAAVLPPDPVQQQGPRYDFGKDAKSGGGADKSRMAEWEAKLSEDKAALTRQGLQEDQFREMSKAKELEYWKGIRSQSGLTAQERLSVGRKTAELEMATIKDGFDQRIAALNTEASAYKNNTDERLRLEREIQSHYAQGTKEYEASAKRIMEIQKQAAEQAQQIEQVRAQATRDAHLAAIALEEQTAQLSVQLGITTQGELLAMQQAFEDQRYQISQIALAERLAAMQADPDRNPVELARIHAEMEKLEQDHQAKIKTLQGQTTLDATQQWRGLASNIQNSMATAIQGVLNGTKTPMQALHGLFRGVFDAITQMLAQMAAKWLATQLMMLVFGKTTALGEISAEAAKAGAGGVASMAAAPFPLNLGAPAFGAAMATAAAGFSSLAAAPGFAVGSWEVPTDMITKVHKGEMIAPAQFADRIRKDESGPSATTTSPVIFQVQAMDARGVRDFFNQHGPAIVDAIQGRNRAFSIKK